MFLRIGYIISVFITNIYYIIYNKTICQGILYNLNVKDIIDIFVVCCVN